MARDLELYETEEGMVLALLQRVQITGTVVEPCVGPGAIHRVLKRYEIPTLTFDIDEQHAADYHRDMSLAESWDDVRCSWVLTNPPFSFAPEILRNAIRVAEVGVAMLLRISFLEPCKGRDKFLAMNPPQQMIVLPRYSFSGDGGKDTVTCAWFVWRKDRRGGRVPIQVVTPDMMGRRPV